MAKFCVLVTRDTTESTEVIVEAPDGTPAREITARALEFVNDNPGEFAFTPDDSVHGDPYLGDPDTAELSPNPEAAVVDCSVSDGE